MDYKYAFLSPDGKIISVIVTADSKFEAACKARALRPDAMQAGPNWFCTEAGEKMDAATELKRWTSR